ncbi:MAG TPA: hypothetical protein ENF81_00150 [Thermotogaceae bacterium]|nr:hypothetical protein [Thermotogaceae bacterium]
MVQSELAGALDMLLKILAKKCWEAGLDNFMYNGYIESIQAHICVHLNYEPASSDFYVVEIKTSESSETFRFTDKNIMNVEAMPLIILSHAFVKKGFLDKIMAAIHKTVKAMEDLTEGISKVTAKLKGDIYGN